MNGTAPPARPRLRERLGALRGLRGGRWLRGLRGLRGGRWLRGWPGFAAGTALLFVLGSVHPGFLLLAVPLCVRAFTLWPLRWAIPSALTVALIVLSRVAVIWRLPLPADQSLLYLGLISLVFGIARALHIDALIQEGQVRQRLLDELEATRKELLLGERRAGVLEERQRLARDIHDTLAQGFAGIVMHLEAAEQALTAGPTAAVGTGVGVAQRHIDQARGTARESLGEARRLVQALRPLPLDDASLSEAVARVVQRWSAENGVATHTMVEGADEQRPLHPEIEVTLLRAVQESLANVQKHARAGHVEVALRYRAAEVELEVRDDGIGLQDAEARARADAEARARADAAARADATAGAAARADATADPTGLAGGYGLRAMRERAEHLGGSCQVVSAPGQGTTLFVRVPISGPAGDTT